MGRIKPIFNFQNVGLLIARIVGSCAKNIHHRIVVEVLQQLTNFDAIKCKKLERYLNNEVGIYT